MTSVTDAEAAKPHVAPTLGTFERCLTISVALCC